MATLKEQAVSMVQNISMKTVCDVQHFCGFPKEFLDFLFSLQFNNTIDLLSENKAIYKQLISEPLHMLFNELAKTAILVSETLIIKPSKCVSTMYNDMRFSRTTPLKGYMYIRFREPSDKDILGLYFDMGCEYYSYGIRIYKQTSAGMERIRESAVEKSPKFIQELEKLNLLDMKIIGDKFVKDHYTEIKNEILKDFLNRKNFYIGRNCPVGESVFNGQMQNEIASAFIELKDMYELLKKSLMP